MLEELQLPYELVERARPVSRRVKAFAPSGKVPAYLEYDNETSETPSFVLTESVAINTYLADTYGQTHADSPQPLIPPVGTKERAKYNQVTACILSELDAQGLWVYRKHTPPMAQYFGGENPAGARVARQQFHRINTLLIQRCSPYLLGDHFSAADILYVHCLDWAKALQWNQDDEWQADAAAIEPYRRLCHSRPTYQRARTIRDESNKRAKL